MHEDDLKWVSNCALFAAAFMLIAGILLAEHFIEDGRTYVKIATIFISAIFAGFGIVIRLYVQKKIKDTTIIKLMRGPR